MSKSSISQFWDKIEELSKVTGVVFTVQQDSGSDRDSLIYAVGWELDNVDKRKDMSYLVWTYTSPWCTAEPYVRTISREMLDTMYTLGKNL